MAQKLLKSNPPKSVLQIRLLSEFFLKSCKVEDLLALLSKRSRECYECACNTAIHKKTDLEVNIWTSSDWEKNVHPLKDLPVKLLLGKNNGPKYSSIASIFWKRNKMSRWQPCQPPKSKSIITDRQNGLLIRLGAKDTVALNQIIFRRWTQTRARSWETLRVITLTHAQNLSPSLTLDQLWWNKGLLKDRALIGSSHPTVRQWQVSANQPHSKAEFFR